MSDAAMVTMSLERSRLRWRARRGLLENDIILTRFLDQYENTLTEETLAALEILLDLTDNDLLDYLLNREPLPEDLAKNQVLVHLLKQLQSM